MKTNTAVTPTINKVFRVISAFCRNTFKLVFLTPLRADKLGMSTVDTNKINEIYNTCFLKLADKLCAKVLSCERRKLKKKKGK